MSIIRTYFDKNNTIISGSKQAVNTGRNPVTEIFYGTDVSRFLFYIDFQALRDKISGQTINPSNIVRHTLKMKNTSNFDVLPFRDYRDQIQFSVANHATSFDLELVPIYEFWDEGTGYDFEVITTCADEQAFVDGASNWKYRTTLNRWVRDGAVASGTTVIATQHFDKGNEDIEMDITDFVNSILTGNTTYSGLCVKFVDAFEVTGMENKTVAAYFTRHTNTFFEPFVETEYDDLVKDDRRNFILDQTNHLVLYVYDRGTPLALDALPICTIGNATFPVTQITKGVYSADVILSSSNHSDYVRYQDIWSNIIINGVTQPNVTMYVTPKPADNRYQIGNTSSEPVKYGISASGIQRDAHLTQGEVCKVQVNLRKPYTVSTVEIEDGIYYRMFVKQGINQVEVIGWTEINRAFDCNYFTVDTSWLVPQQYFIDIKTVIRGEVHIYNEELRFSVVSKM